MYLLDYDDFGDDSDMASEEAVDIDMDELFDPAEFIAFDPEHLEETFKVVTDGVNQITRLVLFIAIVT